MNEMSEYPSLVGRCIAVTGGSRGLGRAMAIGLLHAGARVAIICTGPSPALNETIRQARSVTQPTQWMCAFGDVGDPADCERIAAEVSSAFGRIDVLINNAGARTNGAGMPFWDISTEEWLRIAHTNCDSVFLLSRAVVPSMMERRFGKIINISTNVRTMVREKFSPYGPSKAFVEACTRIWARELAATGVTVNALLPGGNVDTTADMAGEARSGPASLSASVMVGPVLWLSADESNSHSGERFVANLWNEDLELAARVAAARQTSSETPSIL